MTIATIRVVLSFIVSIIGIIAIIPAVLIMFPFWFLTVISNAIEKFKPKAVEWKDRIEYDPALGRHAKPNVSSYMDTDGLYRLTSGSDGWRGNYKIGDSDVVVIGDSFVFGIGVDDKDHFANQTKRARVKPMGAPGYGLTHYLQILKSLSSEIKDKLVVWFVYTGNDFRESIRPTSYGYWFPFVSYDASTQSWKIKTDHIDPKKVPFNFEKSYRNSIQELADLFSHNYLSDYAFGAFEYLAREANDHCVKNGATFAIVILPIRWQIDGDYTFKLKRHASNPDAFSLTYPEERTGEVCQHLGIPWKPTLKEFSREDFLPNDLHWSRQGHEKAAKIIDGLYETHLGDTSKK